MIKLKDMLTEEKKMGTSHFMRMSIAARRIEKEVNKLVKDWRKYGGPKYDGGVPERLNEEIEKLRRAASSVEGSFDFIGKDPDDYVTFSATFCNADSSNYPCIKFDPQGDFTTYFIILAPNVDTE